MFEKIGKIVVGCFVLYILIGLLSTVAIGTTAGTGISGLIWLVLIIGGGAVAYANRARIQSFFSSTPAVLNAGPANPPAAPSLTAEGRIHAHQRRFAEAADALARLFPEDPLDNTAYLEVSHLYLHESPEERQKLEDEYATARSRFERWHVTIAERIQRDTFLTPELAESLLQDYQALDAERAALEQYITDLTTRAGETQALTDRANQMAMDAGAALERARVACHQVSEPAVTTNLTARLERAAATLEEMRAALLDGHERPLSALRLGQEITREAAAIAAQVHALVDLPRAVAAQEQRVAEASAQARREVVQAKAALEAVAGVYAPVCWQELQGTVAAAEHALKQATELEQAASVKHAATAAEPSGPGLEMLHDLVQVSKELEAASRLSHAIMEHIERLDAAARSARQRVEAAEAAIDQGWAALAHIPGDHAAVQRQTALLERAATLVTRARAELAKLEPDWFMVVTLADRGTDLAGHVRPGDPPSSPTTSLVRDSAHERLTQARERAKTARDRALVISWTTGRSGAALRTTTRRLIDRAEQAYQHALTLQADGADLLAVSDDPSTVERAIPAFRAADELAMAAYEQACDDLWGAS